MIRDLESAHAATESHSLVPPTMTIREVSRRFPATRPVLERYGLADCGGEEGPDEPLAWFATVHRLPLDDFLKDIRKPPSRLRRGARRLRAGPEPLLAALHRRLSLPDADPRRDDRHDQPAAHRRRRRRADRPPADPRPHAGHRLRDALPHGHRVPRAAAHPRHRRRAARPVGARQLLADVLRRAPAQCRSAARPPPDRAACSRSRRPRWSSPRGLLFVAVPLRAPRKVREGKYDRRDPLLLFLRAGAFYFLAAILLVAAQGVWLAGHVDTVLPAALNEPFYFAADTIIGLPANCMGGYRDRGVRRTAAESSRRSRAVLPHTDGTEGAGGNGSQRALALVRAHAAGVAV